MHAKMDIIAYFGGSTGIKYVHLPSISPLGNRKKTLKKNPKLRDMYTYCFDWKRWLTLTLTLTLITFFSQNSTCTCTYTLQTVTILKISGKMRPTWCFQMNHSKHNILYNFIHRHAKNTWFLVKKSQIVSKYHDNVVNIGL